MKLKINCNWNRYVDLGLPSGLLWATCNVGAKEPWESGLYFSWGNVDGHKKGSEYNFSDTEYATTPGAALAGDIPVGDDYDAARANLGGSWRTPTTAEFYELYNNCTKEWTTQNGVYGMMLVSMINGNSVFFPCSGFYGGSVLFSDGTRGSYWSSSLDLFLNSHTYAYSFVVSVGGGVYNKYYDSRHLGFPVRAVLDHPKDSLLIKAIKKL